MLHGGKKGRGGGAAALRGWLSLRRATAAIGLSHEREDLQWGGYVGGGWRGGKERRQAVAVGGGEGSGGGAVGKNGRGGDQCR